MSDPSEQTLLEDADRKHVKIRAGGQELSLVHADFGAVLDASVRGNPSPWWAHAWPAGRQLAQRILSGPRLDGETCLDLGCGSGVVGIALARMGARVTFADASADALRLTRENATRNGVQDFELLEMDWSHPPDRQWPRIYAADVLYESWHLQTLMLAFQKLLAPGGKAWIADPKRQPIPRKLTADGLVATIEADDAEFLLVRFERPTPAAH